MSVNEVHFLINKDRRTKLLMSKFRLQKHLKRCTGFFGHRLFPRKLWIMFVCVVWLLTREILCSNLVLVMSFFEWVFCGFSLVSLAKCQNCISNWAITASFHILGVSADHKVKGSDTFPGTSVCFFPTVLKQKIMYSRL